MSVVNWRPRYMVFDIASGARRQLQVPKETLYGFWLSSRRIGLVVRHKNRQSLLSTGLDRRQPRTFLSVAPREGAPRWVLRSPDGRRLAAIISSGRRARIVSFAIGGGRLRTLATIRVDGGPTLACWLADGTITLSTAARLLETTDHPGANLREGYKAPRPDGLVSLWDCH
jgi:hypothetical protein